jgi:hypothetical protein
MRVNDRKGRIAVKRNLVICTLGASAFVREALQTGPNTKSHLSPFISWMRLREIPTNSHYHLPEAETSPSMLHHCLAMR